MSLYAYYVRSSTIESLYELVGVYRYNIIDPVIQYLNETGRSHKYKENKELDPDLLVRREFVFKNPDKDDDFCKLQEIDVPELEKDDQSVFIVIKQTHVESWGEIHGVDDDIVDYWWSLDEIEPTDNRIDEYDLTAHPGDPIDMFGSYKENKLRQNICRHQCIVNGHEYDIVECNEGYIQIKDEQSPDDFKKEIDQYIADKIYQYIADKKVHDALEMKNWMKKLEDDKNKAIANAIFVIESQMRLTNPDTCSKFMENLLSMVTPAIKEQYDIIRPIQLDITRKELTHTIESLSSTLNLDIKIN